MLSYLITFLIGVLTGAAGKYIADKYTDKRHRKEQKMDLQNNFLKIANKMPDLIIDMRNDLLKSQFSVIREFYVLPNSRVPFYSGEDKFFFYYEEKYDNLLHKIKLLEDYGFVKDLTPITIPKYRMSEEFVHCVINSKFKNGKIKF
jgi:hypothetical protein